MAFVRFPCYETRLSGGIGPEGKVASESSPLEAHLLSAVCDASPAVVVLSLTLTFEVQSGTFCSSVYIRLRCESSECSSRRKRQPIFETKHCRSYWQEHERLPYIAVPTGTQGYWATVGCSMASRGEEDHGCLRTLWILNIYTVCPLQIMTTHRLNLRSQKKCRR